jgi:hypothetical protein
LNATGIGFPVVLLVWRIANCNLPIAFCNLAGKDAGQNNTKLLRGPEC